MKCFGCYFGPCRCYGGNRLIPEEKDLEWTCPMCEDVIYCSEDQFIEMDDQECCGSCLATIAPLSEDMPVIDPLIEDF